jgi:hypothetical protein
MLCEDRRSMQHAEPDPAAALLTVVEAVAARADEAGRRLDDLTASLDELEGNGHPSPRRFVDPADPVRLAAIELAVAGADRAETAVLLSARFPEAELDVVLDDVFG